MQIYLSIPQETQEESQHLGPNQSAIWRYSWESICMCQYSQVWHHLHSWSVLMGMSGWRKTRYSGVWLQLSSTYPILNAARSRSPLPQLCSFRDNTLPCWKLSNPHRCKCSSVIIHVRINDLLKPLMRCTVHHISSKEVVSWIVRSQLWQLLKHHWLRTICFQVTQLRCGDSSHHTAGFIFFAQHAFLTLLVIQLSPILIIVRTCMIMPTVTRCNDYRLKCLLPTEFTNQACSTLVILSSSCRTAASGSSNSSLASVVSLST